MHTTLTIDKTRFLINGTPTYNEIPGCPDAYRGMLMNARFIQGIFDDRVNPRRFDRFGKKFDPEKNTGDLIAALPEWYAHGLRGITVGLQGGGPCFTTDSMTIENNPFSPDGREIDLAYLTRLTKILEACDRLGMVVIVSYFYGPQSRFLKDDAAVIEAVKRMSNWLRDSGFRNVIIEIANEHDIEPYKVHPILYLDKGIAELIEIAKRESGGLPVGCSSTGAYFCDIIPKASDVILIHGNNMSRQVFYNQIKAVKKLSLSRPIVCNEDSQALSNMQTALENGVSWGYYNNMTKQEPPADWGITPGEDRFFALRMRDVLGIERVSLPLREQFYLQGLEKNAEADGKRWIRLASICPEKIHRVAFYRNGTLIDYAYDDPFTVNFAFNWIQGPVENVRPDESWRAVVTLVNGEEIVVENR